jgi:hypothetical protein
MAKLFMFPDVIDSCIWNAMLPYFTAFLEMYPARLIFMGVRLPELLSVLQRVTFR